MAFRNNVTRLLDARKIPYQIFELSKEKHSAEETAQLLGVPLTCVYKTLVIVREDKGKKPLLVMAPAGQEVSLKAITAALNEKKKLHMATQAEAEALTRLQTGGISTLALLNKGFEICIEQAALSLPFIHISAGERGANVRLAVPDLISLTGAKTIHTL
jgi:Cys-tRNA(Pro)/Cys-tRNA(Cys) deacylase